ncbi:hypothetical protein D3C73_1383460 [compost metagenome]
MLHLGFCCGPELGCQQRFTRNNVGCSGRNADHAYGSDHFGSGGKTANLFGGQYNFGGGCQRIPPVAHQRCPGMVGLPCKANLLPVDACDRADNT